MRATIEISKTKRDTKKEKVVLLLCKAFLRIKLFSVIPKIIWKK